MWHCLMTMMTVMTVIMHTFISDTYETNSIIFTTNKEITEWAEMMGDPVLTTAMLDRILHHAKCFSLKGESYRLKHPELFS
ncbi:MAG: ATP-binding protein [Firmicutes bacterium]|nr:ATP-binding protein [Bacillota bacterium]